MTNAARTLQYLAEFLGVFFLAMVILVYGGTTCGGLAIGFTLAGVIFGLGYMSGGHFNPAVSMMFMVKGDIDWIDFMFYLVVQCAGALCAYGIFKSALINGFSAPSQGK